MDARRLVVAALAGLIAVASGSTPDWGQTPASVLHLFCPHGTHAICSTPTTCTCVADELVLLTGNVVGLSGKGLTLLNEGYSIAVSANGPVTILARAYEEYGVEVSAVPTGPLQACYVDNGYGTATASGWRARSSRVPSTSRNRAIWRGPSASKFRLPRMTLTITVSPSRWFRVARRSGAAATMRPR